MAWLYEADERPKRKHHWNNPYPGFVRGRRGELVGKCPNNLTPAQLDSLLNTGVSWSRRGWSEPYPERIYAVLDGWLYRAQPTRAGISYHGFPELVGRVPRPPRAAILAQARSMGCEKRIKEYWP